MKLRCCVLLLLMLGPLSADRLMAQQRASAIVLKISGAVILKRGGNQIKLNSNSDLGRRLFGGDKINCQKGAKLSLRLGSRDTELDENSGWFELPRLAARDAGAAQRAIEEYGRIGGRDKGAKSESVLYQPADEDFVVPEMFAIGWNPLRKNCAVKFEIQKPDGGLLWQQEKIAGSAGTLNAESARSLLETYRNATGGVLRLRLSGSCVHDQSSFSLLSVRDENALKSELQPWDNDPSKLMSHLGRAAVFARYQMLAEVANEYEGALTLAPRSRDLLLRTIEAHNRTGNLARVRALKKRLARV